ncbi:C40 family peptidase [Domibacillus epiphyticus]|uniref:NlpC/P60 domain-containing protein n=1 Tax=Domibacillus epiphyticus TaxID=1714355 RepID=A0A1V2A594_9BACI|nr:C40 family peptidase [Domibacillus epiphyticus]OMP66136.1 hypothetical protein BTO28_14125 [Domibacillus epiphyticus]
MTADTVRWSKLLMAALMILVLISSFFVQEAKASPSYSQEVTATAKQYLGVKYKAGGTTPKGFDASGFTQHVFDYSLVDIKLPRTSKQQFSKGKAVSKKDIKEGDLLFFKTNGKDVSFVGISLGKDQFIAVTVKKGVSINSLNEKYWKDTYAGAKRVIK